MKHTYRSFLNNFPPCNCPELHACYAEATLRFNRALSVREKLIDLGAKPEHVSMSVVRAAKPPHESWPGSDDSVNGRKKNRSVIVKTEPYQRPSPGEDKEEPDPDKGYPCLCDNNSAASRKWEVEINGMASGQLGAGWVSVALTLRNPKDRKCGVTYNGVVEGVVFGFSAGVSGGPNTTGVLNLHRCLSIGQLHKEKMNIKFVGVSTPIPSIGLSAAWVRFQNHSDWANIGSVDIGLGAGIGTLDEELVVRGCHKKLPAHNSCK
jgi:hypothetical protein